MDGILLSVSCIFVAGGAKTGLQGVDCEPVEPLVSFGGILVLQVVFCAVITVLPMRGEPSLWLLCRIMSLAKSCLACFGVDGISLKEKNLHTFFIHAKSQ